MFAAAYPFLDVMLTMLVFFMWVLWFWILFRVLADIFRRDDLSGLGKTGWLVFTILLPFLGVFVYVISQGSEMTERSLERARAQQGRFDDYVRDAAGGNGGNGGNGAAEQIGKAKELLDSGAITPTEFDALKHKALA